MQKTDDPLGAQVATFVEALVRSGVRHVCACPGSRSAPLLLACAHAEAQQRLRLWMHLDERSAAYFALGLARALREPVALVATSGTAAANFLPAVIESYFGRVPLVVLTADRPHELRDAGAPQTINQVRLYGEHVKWFVDLPEPAPGDDLLHYVATTAARAVASACETPRGPVHVNWPFREPLVAARLDAPLDLAPVRVQSGRAAPASDLVADLALKLQDAERGLIVCGPQDDPCLPSALGALAQRLQYPILADVLSGVRFGEHDHALVVDAYDAFLRDAPTAARLAPQVIVRVGALPTSKPLQQYLQRHGGARQILVDDGGWRDPLGTASDVLHVDPLSLCAALDRALPTRSVTSWATDWLRTNSATRRAIAATFAQTEELFEGKVFAELSAELPRNATIVLGNSMPVRDADTFLLATSATWRVLGNRGANGIDGVVSTALGASAAGDGPAVLVIGDLSFYHDLNGLLAARQHGLDLLVVLLNNDGGGIFSFLPQAGVEQFETLFGTPHGLDFLPLVHGYGGTFVRAADWPSFHDALSAALGRSGVQVIEVPTERARNVSQHRQVWRAVSEALAPVAVA